MVIHIFLFGNDKVSNHVVYDSIIINSDSIEFLVSMEGPLEPWIIWASPGGRLFYPSTLFDANNPLLLASPELDPIPIGDIWNGDTTNFTLHTNDGDSFKAHLIDLTITFIPAPTDVNEDNHINKLDLMEVIMAFGACDDCCEDVNQDGMVDVKDLLLVLSDLD